MQFQYVKIVDELPLASKVVDGAIYGVKIEDDVVEYYFASKKHNVWYLLAHEPIDESDHYILY